jgi:tetratricopeptide (TPR) repeat protein
LKQVLGSFLVAIAVAAAQDTSWDHEMAKGGRLRDLGQYAQAEAVLQAATEEAERFAAPDSRLATALNDLATVYQLEGQYAKAEPLYRRAIGIWEQNPADSALATGLNNPEFRN